MLKTKAWLRDFIGMSRISDLAGTPAYTPDVLNFQPCVIVAYVVEIAVFVSTGRKGTTIILFLLEILDCCPVL
jgi:hypothetical protein